MVKITKPRYQIIAGMKEEITHGWKMRKIFAEDLLDGVYSYEAETDVEMATLDWGINSHSVLQNTVRLLPFLESKH